MVEVSPTHYDFLLEHAKKAIRHDFDNCGNWIYRQQIIEDCISSEMPSDFILQLQSDQDFEIKRERDQSNIDSQDFKRLVLG